MNKPNWFNRHSVVIFLTVALVIHFCIRVYRVATTDRQHDFAVYHAAGSAYLAGEDPYDLQELNGYIAGGSSLPYLYPPVALAFFAPFSLLEHDTSYLMFLAIKTLALAVLLFLWLTCFARGPDERIALLLIAAFGFHATIVRDINAGNISIFEQAFIWLGMFALIRRKIVPFVALIVTASLFKLTTLALLGVALLLFGRVAFKPLIVGVVAFVAVHAMSLALEPQLTVSFLNNVHLPAEFGAINPSSFALLQEVGLWFGSPVLAYILFTLVLGGALYGLFLVYNKRADLDSSHTLIYAALFVYALISPRFKDYSYILLIPPAAYIIACVLRTKVAQVVGLALVCLTVFGYQPLMAAGLLFVVFVWKSHSSNYTIAKSI